MRVGFGSADLLLSCVLSRFWYSVGSCYWLLFVWIKAETDYWRQQLNKPDWKYPEILRQIGTGLFTDSSEPCRLLDAGAGIGSLSTAFLDRWEKGEFSFKNVELDVFEIDNRLIPYLSQTLDKYKKTRIWSYRLRMRILFRQSLIR